VLSCAAAALVATRQGPRNARTILVLDEAWSLLSNEGAARWLQSGFKLARAHGIAHVLVLHRLSDLGSAGAAGSVTASIAPGLLRDVETAVLFAQPPAEAEALGTMLGLTAAECEVVARLPRAAALWRVGAARSVVRHAISAADRSFIDTDEAMRG
jgi:type IV secretory pathway VirB4 component